MAIQPNQTSVLCVICHQPISLSNFGMGRTVLEQDYVGCPNGHLTHKTCLQQWIVHSKSCPVCHEPYDMRIIDIFNSYLQQIEEDKKQAEVQKRVLEEQQAQIISMGNQMEPEFVEKFKRAEKLVEEQNFSAAINLYWDILDQAGWTDKDTRRLQIILHLSIVYIKMGKQALAIRQLMKIVKHDYNYPLAFYFLGVSYIDIGLPDKAKWAFERALPNTQKLAEDDSYYDAFITDMQTRMKGS